jgi:hypothetical protein
MLRRNLKWGLVTALVAAALPALAAEDPCAGFSWDVGHERAVFATAPEVMAAADGPALLRSSREVSVDRLYGLKLLRQTSVTYVIAPGRAAAPEAAYGGLVHLRVPSTGVWRISLDAKLWVDVLADGAAIQSGDYQGRPGCSAPHKIVEFTLPAGKSLTVQLSGDAASTVRFAVTRAAARTP